MIDTEVLQEVFDEVFSALEAVETQNGAILQFLKDRGIASDEDLAPFREKAAKTSSVRGRAARIRANHLLSGAAKAMELAEEKSRRDTDAKKAASEPAESRSEEHEKHAAQNTAGSSGEAAGSADAKKKAEDQSPAGGKRDQAGNNQTVNSQPTNDQPAKKEPATNKDAA
jgi:hypothetical protein